MRLQEPVLKRGVKAEAVLDNIQEQPVRPELPILAVEEEVEESMLLAPEAVPVLYW
jgi:hypothetical protein